MAGLDLSSATAVQVLHALETRAVSSQEITQAYLDRIESLNPKINAVVTTDHEGALAAAAAADQARAKGAGGH